MTETPDILDPTLYAHGLARVTEYQVIYENPSLVGKLAQLRDEAEMIESFMEDEPEQSMGGDPELRRIQAEYDKIYADYAATRKVYKLQGLTSDEVEKIAIDVRTACKDEANAKAKTAREWAAEQAEREGLEDGSDLTDMVRYYGREAAAAVINRENGFHMLAAQLIEPKLTLDEVRELPERLGEVQVNKLLEAAQNANRRDPASVPKSLRRGKKAEA